MGKGGLLPTLLCLCLAAPSVGTGVEARLTTEGRGLWVPAWELTTPAAVTRVFELAEAYGFNEVFLQVRYRGDTLYRPNRHDSTFYNPEPRSPYISSQPAAFDPLAQACEAAHAAGISLHAWVVCFEITGGRTPTHRDHVVHRHPEWVSHDDSRRPLPLHHRSWLDPGIPQVRDYTVGVLLDIVANYPVDGLHLDYVRYRDHKMGFAPLALAEYRRRTGYHTPEENRRAWADWRRENINSFVEDVTTGARALRPDIIVSAAVFAERSSTAFNDTSQDWGLWLRDDLIDLVVTMSYFTDRARIIRQLDDAVRQTSGALVYGGLLLRELHNDQPLIPAAELRAQLDAVRSRGADGVVLFSYTDLLVQIRLGLKPGDLFEGSARVPQRSWPR